MYWTGVCCAIFAALIAFGIVPRHRNQNLEGSRGIAAPARASFERPNPLGGAALPQQRLYPYSVIPGGVENARELRNAIAHDPAVAALYANFDVSRARVIRLAHDREVYVSYRLDGRIYWTKKRVLLPAGETLITDGKHEARTRCGNKISETPVQPVSENEPPDSAMNSAAPNYVLLAENPGPPQSLPVAQPIVDPISPPTLPVTPPASGPPVTPIPPPFFPVLGGGPPSTPPFFPPPPPPPVATPEPGTLWLLAIGLLALGVAAAIAKTRAS